MALVINTNIASMNGQKNLSKTQDAQAQTFQRLSTGLRINSAKDDAAGLFLAQNQTKDIRGLEMATRNAGDGISMAQTAEGALDQIGNNLQRINELAIQSANGTYSAEARGGLQKEVNELTQEINRIIETTEFNGQKLLSSDAQSETLQIGFGNNAGSRITTGMEGGMVKLAGMESVTFMGANENFAIDRTALTATGGTTEAHVATAFAKTVGLEEASAGAGLTAATAGDELTAQINQALKTFQGSADTLGEAVFNKFGEDTDGVIQFTAKGVEFNIAVQANASGTVIAAAGSGPEAASFASYGGTFMEIDGLTGFDINGTENFRDNPNATVGTVTISEGYTVRDETDGSFAAGDVGVKVADGNALNGIINGGLNGTLTVDISTQAAAQTSIDATRNAIDMVSEVRAEFGANMNRFDAVISGNQTYTENLSAARSRIQDADFAVETANLAKQQVLQQAGVAALGQANASSQVVLGLL